MLQQEFVSYTSVFICSIYIYVQDCVFKSDTIKKII